MSQFWARPIVRDNLWCPIEHLGPNSQAGTPLLSYCNQRLSQIDERVSARIDILRWWNSHLDLPIKVQRRFSSPMRILPIRSAWQITASRAAGCTIAASRKTGLQTVSWAAKALTRTCKSLTLTYTKINRLKGIENLERVATEAWICRISRALSSSTVKKRNS